MPVRSLNELYGRLTVAKNILATFRGDPAMMRDPRASESIAEYERQEAVIQAEIDAQKPKDIVIGLKTAKLFGKVEKI